MRKLLFWAVIMLSLTRVNAQSLSGNIHDMGSASDLGYANVDLYKNGELVASVIADREGNFNVALDTGSYKCTIRYAGYDPIETTVRIKGDEKSNFGLNRNKDLDRALDRKRGDHTGVVVHSRKAPIEEVEMEYDADDSYSYSTPMITESRMAGIELGSGGYYPTPGGDKGVAGKLTAGEVNDFAKWELWTDLSKDELKLHAEMWQLSMQQRYLVQVSTRSGMPLADRTVRLIDAEENILYQARTDNTGKAELWQSITHQKSIASGALTIVLFAREKIEKMRAKPFEKGINAFTLNEDCEQSQKVDIAFVVDATGSMGDEMAYLTAELNDVIFKAKDISTSLDMSFANVFYRDHGDSYLTSSQDFTRVLSESVRFISNHRAGGGGDYEEAVDVALDSAINRLSWSDHARARILFLILDAPPHPTDEIKAKMQTLIAQAAEKGIRIVPLASSGINKATEYLLRSIALGTNGTYSFLTDHSGIGGSHIEPSTDEYKVETLNDLLVRVIKSFTYMPDCEQQLPDLDLEYPDSSVSYTSKDTATGDSTPVNISWSYYPNPTRDWVTIKADVQIKELYITDLSGKVLQMVKDIHPEMPVKVDMRGYTSGIYLIRYPVGDRWISGKVVVVRES